MKKIFSARNVLILLSILTAFSLITASAAIPSPGKDFYYYDEAGIMTTETKSMLHTNGEALKKACGAQIVVLVVNSLGGMKIEDYAYAVINEWGVGDKEEHNGVVLVIDEKGGEYRMTIGTGLERYMNSAMVQRMLEGYFDSHFKEYKTDLAIRNLYKALFEKIKEIYRLNISLVGGSDLPGEMMIYEEDTYEKTIDIGGKIIAYGIIILIIIYFIRKNMKKIYATRPGTTGSANTTQNTGEKPTVVINNGSSNSFWRGFIAGSMNSSHRYNRPGSFGSSFGSSSSRSSGGSFRSGGFGGARGGGGGGRGIGGGGRR